uniref:Uncharacterized protein n=1 Tax=Timema genevievae TaxID=629358 RepID=A0A7R9PPU4_TIMGE|nr:unnamed protein product [Timema genevievae]
MVTLVAREDAVAKRTRLDYCLEPDLRRYCVAGTYGATVELSQSNDRFRIWGVESGRTRIGSVLTWCALWTQDYQDNNRPASSLTNEEITYHGSDQDPHCQGVSPRLVKVRRVVPPASLRALFFTGTSVSLKEESEGDGRFLVFRVLLSVFQTPRTMPVGIRSPATEQGRPTAEEGAAASPAKKERVPLLCYSYSNPELANAPVVLSQTTEDGEIEVRISNVGRPSEDLALDSVGYNVFIFLSLGTNCRRHVWNE